jgi:hypothetical protein
MALRYQHHSASVRANTHTAPGTSFHVLPSSPDSELPKLHRQRVRFMSEAPSGAATPISDSFPPSGVSTPVSEIRLTEEHFQ